MSAKSGRTINVKELRTLEGYLLDTTPKSIKIKAGAAQTLRFYNQKAGTLVIRKLDPVTKKSLAGVEFQLTYSDGSYVDADNGHLSSKGLFTTNRNGEIRISGVTFLIMDSSGELIGPANGEYVTDRNGRIVLYDLTPGTTITAKEVRTAEGFVLDSTPQSIRIKEGEAQKLTFFNKIEGGVEIIKVSESDKTQRIHLLKIPRFFTSILHIRRART